MLLVALAAIFILVQPSKVIYIKLLSVPALCLLFILCLILLSDAAVKSALDGMRLWAGVVVPSLFPFFAAAEIMNSSGFIRASGLLLEPVMRPLFNVPGCGSFALVMGILSGYPVGAKITCDLKNNGELDKVEAERLLAFTNNSGPLFIIGAVGTGMYGSPRLGIFIYICHLLACITVGFIFRFYKTGSNMTRWAMHKANAGRKHFCEAGFKKSRQTPVFKAFR
ncbi:MAG: nucleoside recognition domain-containing protein, partial [Clostridiaceae bacterium]